MRLTIGARAQFGGWLVKCGAEVLPPVGQWEIFRVVANGTTLSAYARKTGFQNWPEPLQQLYAAFRNGKMLQLGTVQGPAKAMSGNKRSRIVKIAERDGWTCWYCNHPLQPIGFAEDPKRRPATLEEVCPRQIGGPTHIGNQVIACAPCNNEAANLSVAQKVRMRDRRYAARARVLISELKTHPANETPHANGGSTEAEPPHMETQIPSGDGATVPESV
jgi:hypothetical protein